jgi:hypothetical protein
MYIYIYILPSDHKHNSCFKSHRTREGIFLYLSGTVLTYILRFCRLNERKMLIQMIFLKFLKKVLFTSTYDVFQCGMLYFWYKLYVVLVNLLFTFNVAIIFEMGTDGVHHVSLNPEMPRVSRSEAIMTNFARALLTVLRQYKHKLLVISDACFFLLSMICGTSVQYKRFSGWLVQNSNTQ